MEFIKLNNNVQMPLQGYGVFLLTDLKQCFQCVSDALQIGCRLIDTAASYHNEEAVGEAVRNSGIPRKELFITTKLWIQDAGYEETLKAFDLSLKRLKLDYLDLYLIHQPFGDYYGAWRAMERLYKEGAIRAIGVSNFTPDRLVDLCMNVEIPPAVDQVEMHPFFQQQEAVRVMESLHVQPQAWGPLFEGQRDIFYNKTLQKIADKHERSVAQIILRWHCQRGVPAIPKTVRSEHMKENVDIWDFQLTENDMKIIAGMDTGHSEIVDSRCYCTARQLNGIKIHA